MRVVQQPAFILHRRPYRNTSLLVEALARDHGRIALVARGVQTQRSRLKGLLQPFTPLSLSWVGSGDLVTLSAAEEDGAAITLPPARLWSGFYINELLLRVLARWDAHPRIFDYYQWVLLTLQDDANEETALRLFEKRLLSELGYALLLNIEAFTGVPIASSKVYRYVLDRGPIPIEQSIAGTSIEVSGRSLLALHQETLTDPADRRAVKRLTRAAIAQLLEGKPLKTREMLLASLKASPKA